MYIYLFMSVPSSTGECSIYWHRPPERVRALSFRAQNRADGCPPYTGKQLRGRGGDCHGNPACPPLPSRPDWTEGEAGAQNGWGARLDEPLPGGNGRHGGLLLIPGGFSPLPDPALSSPGGFPGAPTLRPVPPPVSAHGSWGMAPVVGFPPRVLDSFFLMMTW